MKILLSDIVWEQRAREDFGDISVLAESLRDNGQIQPIVIDDKKRLLDGGRRYVAAAKLGWKELDYVLKENLNQLERKVIELESNFNRKAFEWPEEVKLRAEIADMKQELHPEWDKDKIAESLGLTRRQLNRDMHVAKAIESSPEVLKCDSKDAALSLSKRIIQTKRRELITFDKEDNDEVDIFHADAIEKLKELKPDSIDLVLFDPPYGIDVMDTAKTAKGKWKDRWIESMRFDDSALNAMELIDSILAELSRVMKEGAHCYLFFSLVLEGEFNPIAHIISKHLSYQKAPLFWIKNTHSNKEPYTRFGVNYEPIYFCWKGKSRPRNLNRPHFANFNHPVNTITKKHPTEKPVKLYEELISLSTVINETVLDPTAGSGSCVRAAMNSGRKVIAIEKDEAYFNIIKENVQIAKGGKRCLSRG